MATDTVRSCSRFLDKLAEMVPAKYFIDTGKVRRGGRKEKRESGTSCAAARSLPSQKRTPEHFN